MALEDINSKVVGSIAANTQPQIKQVFIKRNSSGLSDKDFNLRLFIARKISENLKITNQDKDNNQEENEEGGVEVEWYISRSLAKSGSRSEKTTSNSIHEYVLYIPSILTTYRFDVVQFNHYIWKQNVLQNFVDFRLVLLEDFNIVDSFHEYIFDRHNLFTRTK